MWRFGIAERYAPISGSQNVGAARAYLMPVVAWRLATGFSNVELAEAFNVPLDEVVQRRVGLGRDRSWHVAPGRSAERPQKRTWSRRAVPRVASPSCVSTPPSGGGDHLIARGALR